MSRTIFYGPKDVRAIEGRLYMDRAIRNGVFENVYLAKFRFIPRLRKVSSRLLLSIATFCSVW